MRAQRLPCGEVGADPRVRRPRGSQTPSPSTGEGWGEGDSPVVGADPRVRPLRGSQTPSPSTGEGWGEGDSPVVGADPRVRPPRGSQTPSPSTGEGWGEGDFPVVGADPRVRPPRGSQTPSPSTGEGWGEGDFPVVGADPRVRPLRGSQTPSPSTGEGWGEGDSPVVGADPCAQLRRMPLSLRQAQSPRSYSPLSSTPNSYVNAIRKFGAALAGVLLLAAAACGTSDPAPTPQVTPTPAVESTAVPTAAPPTPTVAAPTPTASAPTSATPSMAGIDVDPAKAEATLVQLVDALDEPEYYCVDVPGFGGSLSLQSALMAHTCKPGADLRCNCTLYHFVFTTPLIDRDAVRNPSFRP